MSTTASDMREPGFAWWNEGEIPTEVRQASGVLAFQRVAGGAGGILIGEADDLQAALAGTDVEVGRFALRATDPRDARPDLTSVDYLMVVHVEVDEGSRVDYRRWMDEEHSAAQLTVAGTQWFQGFDEIGGRNSIINFWGLADPSVIESPEWATARDTAWRERLLPAVTQRDRAVLRPF